MDTDDLTEMAYETVAQAYGVCDVLRAEIGACAASFKREEEYLRGTLEFLDEILEDPEEYLESWYLLGETNAQSFVRGICVGRSHVSVALNTPAEPRGKPPFERNKCTGSLFSFDSLAISRIVRRVGRRVKSDQKEIITPQFSAAPRDAALRPLSVSGLLDSVCGALAPIVPLCASILLAARRTVLV